RHTSVSRDWSSDVCSSDLRAGGDVALLIGVEGGHAIENSLEMLGRFHAAGVRYLTLTWNNGNDWADACCSPARHGGLTAFGREEIGRASCRAGGWIWEGRR